MDQIKNLALSLIGLVVIVGSIYFVYQQKVGVATVPTLVSESATTTSAHIELSYPKSSKTLYPEVFDFITKVKSDFETQYGNVSADQITKDYGRPDVMFELYMSTRIATSTKTTSFIIETYEYTGGAHGGTSVTTFTYDRAGKMVTIDKVFGGSYLKTISPLARKYFYNKFGDDSQPFMIDDGTEPKAENFSSWYLTDNTVTFIFGQYQVGPYSMGIQEFAVDKTSVNSILNTEFR